MMAVHATDGELERDGRGVHVFPARGLCSDLAAELGGVLLVFRCFPPASRRLAQRHGFCACGT